MAALRMMLSSQKELAAEKAAEAAPLNRESQEAAVTAWSAKRIADLGTLLQDPANAKVAKQYRAAAQGLHRAYVRLATNFFLTDAEWAAWEEALRTDFSAETERIAEATAAAALDNGGEKSAFSAANAFADVKHEMQMLFLQSKMGTASAVELWTVLIDEALDAHAAASAAQSTLGEEKEQQEKGSAIADAEKAAMTRVTEARSKALALVELAVECEGSHPVHGKEIWAMQRRAIDMLYVGNTSNEKATRESFHRELTEAALPDTRAEYEQYLEWELSDIVKRRFEKEFGLVSLMQRVEEVLLAVNDASRVGLFDTLRQLCRKRFAWRGVSLVLCSVASTAAPAGTPALTIPAADLTCKVLTDLYREKAISSTFLLWGTQLVAKRLRESGVLQTPIQRAELVSMILHSRGELRSVAEARKHLAPFFETHLTAGFFTDDGRDQLAASHLAVARWCVVAWRGTAGHGQEHELQSLHDGLGVSARAHLDSALGLQQPPTAEALQLSMLFEAMLVGATGASGSAPALVERRSSFEKMVVSISKPGSESGKKEAMVGVCGMWLNAEALCGTAATLCAAVRRCEKARRAVTQGSVDEDVDELAEKRARK